MDVPLYIKPDRLKKKKINLWLPFVSFFCFFSITDSLSPGNRVASGWKILKCPLEIKKDEIFWNFREFLKKKEHPLFFRGRAGATWRYSEASNWTHKTKNIAIHRQNCFSEMQTCRCFSVRIFLSLLLREELFLFKREEGPDFKFQFLFENFFWTTSRLFLLALCRAGYRTKHSLRRRRLRQWRRRQRRQRFDVNVDNTLFCALTLLDFMYLWRRYAAVFAPLVTDDSLLFSFFHPGKNFCAAAVLGEEVEIIFPGRPDPLKKNQGSDSCGGPEQTK